jgi:hypothetical protein
VPAASESQWPGLLEPSLGTSKEDSPARSLSGCFWVRESDRVDQGDRTNVMQTARHSARSFKTCSLSNGIGSNHQKPSRTYTLHPALSLNASTFSTVTSVKKQAYQADSRS